jgi:dihydrofolate reductase/thymidylate synthase
MQLELIAAISYRSRGIGAAGQLPWHIPSELKHFASVTSNAPNNMINAVIMGKNTWESIPQNKRPLKNRINVVLSRKGIQLEANDEHLLVCDSLQGAVEKLSQRKNINKVFVIGGQQVYSEAIKSPNCSKIYITEIYQNYECDTFFPEIDLNRFAQEASSPVMFYNDIAYQHFTFVQKAHSERQDSTVNYDEMSYSDHPEHQYLNLIREILESGIKRGDRTGTGTISLYGKQMKFSLRNDEFPLLTTKRVFWRGVVEELLWFVAGSTNSNLLRDKGIHVISVKFFHFLIMSRFGTGTALKSFCKALDWDIGKREILGLCMGFNGGILEQSIRTCTLVMMG